MSSWPIGLPFHFLPVLNALLAKPSERTMKILDKKRAAPLLFNCICSFFSVFAHPQPFVIHHVDPRFRGTASV